MTQRVVNYTYGTGNPVLPDGSIDVRDGIDNLQSFDVFINSDDDTYNQRDGEIVKTLAGAVRDIGIPIVGNFTDGCTVTQSNQGVQYIGGSVYRWAGTLPKIVPPSSSPSTTGGIYPSGDWVDVGDASILSKLKSEYGASMVGFAPALPGATNNTTDKFMPKTSPLSYGAKFNGIDDDTDGINNAIKANGPNSYCVIQFPAGASAKIAGTVLIPSGVKVDLNGCIVSGVNTNTLFESGKWVGSSIVSSFNDAPEVSLTVDAWIGNGLVQKCMSAVKINNWVAGCRVHNLRGSEVNQLVHAKRSFYCEFYNLIAWSPLDGTLLPCFHWETAIQAQGAKRCFAVGYTKGHTIQGPNDMESFDTCGAESCVSGAYITGTGALGGGGSGLTFRNWYFENNETAIKADPAYNYENIDIDNSFFNECYVLVDGPTILSGRFGRMNNVKTSVSAPGNFNMTGNLAGKNGFVIELGELLYNNNITVGTIDMAGRFFVGPNVRIERVVTLADAGGAPYARNIDSPNLPVTQITGNQFGNIPVDVIPFCETYYALGTLNVKTQVPYGGFAMVAYNISVTDTSGIYWVRGIVMGDQVFPLSSGQKTVSLQNNGGVLQLNVELFSGASTYKGVVKLL